jgi:hypothetical protein
MCNLSLLSQLAGPKLELEWWMHYQIPAERLEHFHRSSVEVKASELPNSETHPNFRPGKGLFATTAIKKGGIVCGIPGFWMHTNLFEEIQRTVPDNYCLAPTGGDWPDEMDLVVYMAHACQGNYINSGTVGNEVLTRIKHVCTKCKNSPHTPT